MMESSAQALVAEVLRSSEFQADDASQGWIAHPAPSCLKQ
jgi:hypothetical protein